MSFSPFIVLFLQTAGVLVVARVVMLLTPRAPAIRLMVGRSALVAVVGLIALSPWTRLRKNPVVAVDWNPAVSVSPATHALPSKKAATGQSPVIARPPRQLLPSGLREAKVVELTWLLGVLGLTMHLGFGYRTIWRTRRESRPVLDERVLAMLETVAKDAGIRAPALVLSDRVGGPIVSGVFHPTIFLPQGFLDSGRPEEVSAVLRHEAGHIANGDLKWQLFHRVVSILAWPQFLIRTLAAPMATASEELCDAQVLTSGIAGAHYADCLLRLRQVAMTRRTSQFGIGMVSKKREISARIEAILADRRARTRVTRPVALLISVGAVLAALGVTGVFAVPLEPAPNGRLTSLHTRVKLVGPDGRPVMGARAWMQITGNVSNFSFRPLKVTADGVAVDADNIPAYTRTTLIVHAKGLALGIVRLTLSESKVMTLQLGNPNRVSGRLLLPDGSAAAGASVRVAGITVGEPPADDFNAILLDPDCPINFVAVSDGTGNFSFDELPAGASVRLDPVDGRYAHLGFSGNLTVSADGSAPTKDVKLRAAAQVSGRVMRNGQPVAGVDVGVQSVTASQVDGWGDSVTDAEGRYLIKQLPATTYNIALKLDDKQQTEFTAPAHGSVSLREGATLDGMDFDLIPGAVIQGRVLDAVGRPLANSEVGIYGPMHPRTGAWVQGAFTDAKGHYLMRVPAGEQYVYLMTPRASEESAWDRGTTVTVQDGTVTLVYLQE